MDWASSIYDNVPQMLNFMIGPILILVLILATYMRLYSIDRFRRNLFCSFFVFCLASIISDLAFILLEGISGGVAYSLRYLFGALHNLFQVLSCYYIMVFIDYMIFKRTYRSGRGLRAAWIIIDAKMYEQKEERKKKGIPSAITGKISQNKETTGRNDV